MNSQLLYWKSSESMQKFIVKQLRRSGFVDPVTAEDEHYNRFIDELINDLEG